ncbi:MAG TPA: amidohydrolase family protein [Sedimentisphaerales bacterium]|nr:amidohydrolase family protein [Sedimentisphaerales bacterium]
MRHACSIAVIILAALTVSSSIAKDEPAPAKYAIKAGKILTMAPGREFVVGKGVINNGIILISNEKIEALGPASSIQIPEGYTVIDASDRWVTPGIVEAHTHIGAEGGFNDMVTPINPELKIADSVNPEDISVEKGVTGGVTTINAMPGSGTNLAGFSVIIKLDPSDPEKMIFREYGAMKMTQAFNPERRAGDLGATRMGMSWFMRQILKQAKEYTEAWRAYERGERKEKPKYKLELEKMRKAFNGEMPTIVHTYSGWGVMQSIRMFNDENNLKVIPTHTAYGGYIVGQEAAKRDGVFINIGPRVIEFSRPTYDGRFHGMGAEYKKAGVKELSINTDSVGWSSYIAPQEELSFQASMSAHFGLDDRDALKGITINSARALGIDDRVGSLEVGKDADIAIKKGSLLDHTSPVDLVLINGKIIYQRKGVNLVGKQKTAPREKES